MNEVEVLFSAVTIRWQWRRGRGDDGGDRSPHIFVCLRIRCILNHQNKFTKHLNIFFVSLVSLKLFLFLEFSYLMDMINFKIIFHYDITAAAVLCSLLVFVSSIIFKMMIIRGMVYSEYQRRVLAIILLYSYYGTSRME